MVLGTDVSGLTTTAANAAAQGLSIVVPAYNEAAGLALLHQRLGGVAKALRQRYSIGCQGVYFHDGTTAATLNIARSLPTHGLHVPVMSLPPKFRQEDAPNAWTA